MSKSPSPTIAMDGQRKLFWVLVLSASCIFLLGAGTLYLINNKIVASEKIVADKQAQVGSNEQIAKRYQMTLANYNDTVQQLRFLEPKMPHDSYVATLVQQLQRKAEAEGVKLNSVRPSDETDPNVVKAAAVAPGEQPKKVAPSPYTQLMCSVTVSGTYPQIMRFVYDIPRFPKIISVQGIGLRPSTQAVGFRGTPILTADIGLIAYIFNDAPAASSALGANTPVADAGALHTVAFTSNPVAFASARAANAARSVSKAADVNNRSGGLLDAARGSRSIQGGLGSEQKVPIR